MGSPIFGKIQRELFNTILEELDLKFDRDGSRRSAYSLRHTYICLHLMEGANIDAPASNVRKPKRRPMKSHRRRIARKE